jgi:hypothetical protein
MVNNIIVGMETLNPYPVQRITAKNLLIAIPVIKIK